MKCSFWKVFAPVSLLALAACSEASDEQVASSQMAEAEAAMTLDEIAPSGTMAPLAERAELSLALPKMAYVFDYGFRLAGDAIAPLQQKHADMCEALGPYQCQIVSLTRIGEKDEIAGELQLAVASDKARSFATALTATAESDGAESVRADIKGEDLSKSLVDTEARLRTRIALRDRLLEVLETRKGTVQELVDAERGVAAVNEEIDQARSWLAEQKDRVAFSRMTLTYEAATPGGSFLAPIRGVMGSIGSVLGVMVAAIILMLAVAGPLALAVFCIKRLQRRFAQPAQEA